MQVGDLLDAMDKERCWFESHVVEIRPQQGVKVHFLGWGSKWDDFITAAELPTRLAPLNTRTKVRGGAMHNHHPNYNPDPNPNPNYNLFPLSLAPTPALTLTLTHTHTLPNPP